MFKKNANSRPRRSVTQTTKVDYHQDDDDTEVEEEFYEVDSIRGKKIGDDNRLYYLVKWKGYAGSPTWEPADGCNCDIKLQEYEKLESSAIGGNGKTSPKTKKFSKSPSVESQKPNSQKLKSSSPPDSVRVTRNRRSVL